MSGKRDRPAHFDIDEKTLEYKENPQSKKESEMDKAEDIKQRKIYRIKGAADHKEVESASKPKFTLFADHPKSEKKEQKPEQQSKQEATEKVPEKDEPSKEKGENKQAQNKLFSAGFSGFSFSTDGTPKFGNGFGIFTNNQKGEGLFTKNNLFSSTNQETGKSDLGLPKASNPFFSGSQGQNIFNFSSGVPPVKKQTPAVTKNDEEGEDGDSAELEKDQKEVADPTKSTGNYQYNADCQLVFQGKILKLKRNDGEVLENTEVVLQQDKEKKVDWVIVRLCATKNPIVTGFLVKGKSEIKKLGNKDQNVVVSVLAIKDKHPQRQVLKMQFEKPEDGKAFRQAVEGLLK